jgi:CO/xanthine dehydrogenase FAD-binding subunit
MSLSQNSDIVKFANLARMLYVILHCTIRNRGTIGGSVAHADPDDKCRC